MVSSFRIFLGVLSLYVGLGLLFDCCCYETVKQIKSQEELEKFLERITNPSKIKMLLEIIFLPITLVMNAIRLNEIRKAIQEELNKMGDE